MKRLIKKIRDKISKMTSSGRKKEDLWEDRKKELLNNVRSGDIKKKETPAAKSPAPRYDRPRQKSSAEDQKQTHVQKDRPGKNFNQRKNTDRPGESNKEKPVQKQQRPSQKERQPRPPQQSKNADRMPESGKEGAASKQQRPQQPPRKRPEPKPKTEEKKELNVSEPVQPELKWDPSAFIVEHEEGKTRFHDFGLPSEVMHAIADLNFKYCTPIQAQILSKTLAGQDASGKAQTGTGKTAAFLITILTNFLRKPSEKRRPGSPRALIMAPTRELVMQITHDAHLLSKYTNIKTISIVGGIDYQKQKRQLTTYFDIAVATPGRLLDFYSKRDIHLSGVEILVIDEADRMMDMGFIPDMRKIIRATPRKEERQTLLFSATLPSEVLRLASSWTKDSEVVDVEPNHVAGKNVEQITYIVSNEEKYPLLYNVITKKELSKVIIFTNRRDQAKDLRDRLYANGLNSEVLSGDVDQRKRMRTLSDFKEGKINFLVATDVAGRGIHIEGISHVVNYNLPEDPEDYVHRIGRTGRAGAEGISISFASEDDSFQIPAIEKFLGNKLELIYPEEELLTAPPAPERKVEKEEQKPQRNYKSKPNYRHNRPPRRKP